jgi:hypothetical protein
MVVRIKHTSFIRAGITAKKSGQKGFQHWPKKTTKLAKKDFKIGQKYYNIFQKSLYDIG